MDNPYHQYMYSYPHKTAYRALEDIHLSEYIGRLSGKENSFYVHLPFCQYKCGYCNLFSVVGQSERLMADYVDAMQRHAGQLAGILPEGTRFTDLTLGGGTPLILPEVLLRRVFSMVREYFGFEAGKCPVVVETSPNQTTGEKLTLLKEEGVNRVSIGVQSFQEEELVSLHRFHTVESARKALYAIKEMHFDCMNVDLIYGIPGQTAASLVNSMKQALEFEPEELFVYPLYVKPDTFLYGQGTERSADTFLMYQHVREFLQSAGYQQYSMRRFVRKGREYASQDSVEKGSLQQMDGEKMLSSLPISLCGFGNTLSLGCGGRSYIGNLHFCTPYAVKQKSCLSILKEYMEQRDYLQVTHGFILSPEEEKRRYVIKHILFGRGISLQDYDVHFRGEPENDFPILREWESSGYTITEDGYISLTEEGFALSDYLGPQLISDEVRRRMG